VVGKNMFLKKKLSGTLLLPYQKDVTSDRNEECSELAWKFYYFPEVLAVLAIFNVGSQSSNNFYTTFVGY
jgi:hypothetical protein